MTKRFNITITNGKPTCPELPGYELPEWRHQDNDVEAMAEHSSEVQEGTYTPQHKVTYKHGFIDGYRKARERFEFTESDLRQAVALSLDDAEKSVIWSKEWYPNKLADKIIASLRNRTPIAIEVEMVPMCADDAFGKTYQIGWQPILNPDGTVKGRWVYE